MTTKASHKVGITKVALANIPNPTPVRQLRAWVARLKANRAWALYLKTKRPEHAWDSYVAWRQAAPSDLPLPREILKFLDDIACDQLGGPHSASKHAAAGRHQRDIAEWVLREIERHHLIGEAKRGFKTRIYDAAALKFSTTRQEVKNIAHDFHLSTYEDKFLIRTKLGTE